MRIFEVSDNKRDYMDLLFLADEQEDMIDKYLDGGKMYVLEDDGVKGECVVTDEGEGVLELKISLPFRNHMVKDMEDVS